MALDAAEILDGSVKLLLLGMKIAQTVKALPPGTDVGDEAVAVVKAHIDEANALFKQIRADVQD